MNFLADTIVVWTTQPTGALQAGILDYVAEMAAQGLTDNAPFGETLPDGKYKVTRKWTSVQAADSWVTFVTTLGPVSAEVVLL